jgi:hypothetical protein
MAKVEPRPCQCPLWVISGHDSTAAKFRNLQTKNPISEPMVERLIAPVTAWDGRLRATIRRVGGTLQAYMDLVSMAIPGTHLGHPRSIILAEFFFIAALTRTRSTSGLDRREMEDCAGRKPTNSDYHK